MSVSSFLHILGDICPSFTFRLMLISLLVTQTTSFYVKSPEARSQPAAAFFLLQGQRAWTNLWLQWKRLLFSSCGDHRTNEGRSDGKTRRGQRSKRIPLPRAPHFIIHWTPEKCSSHTYMCVCVCSHRCRAIPGVAPGDCPFHSDKRHMAQQKV